MKYAECAETNEKWGHILVGGGGLFENCWNFSDHNWKNKSRIFFFLFLLLSTSERGGDEQGAAYR